IRGNSAKPSASVWPSMTRARTPSTMLCTRGFSVCCETARSASSRGSPARASVASCRVNSARSPGDTRRARLKERWRLASFSATSVTETGSSCCSRSCWRIWRGVSPSRMPLRSRPPASRAVYSNAPNSILARDAQYFLDGGFAAQHPGAAVVADRGRGDARVAVDLLLRDAVVNHGAHGVIDDDQLVDARAAAIAAGGVATRSIQRGGGLVGPQVEEAPLVLARLERLLAIRAQHAHHASAPVRRSGSRTAGTARSPCRADA